MGRRRPLPARAPTIIGRRRGPETGRLAWLPSYICFRRFGNEMYRFYLGGHISAEARINERIRVPEVRLVGPGGEQVGIVRTDDARKLAYEADLDLVEVAPNAKPPVCKIMDYGKFKYEQAKKDREARKKQHVVDLKEIRMSVKIGEHDFNVWFKAAETWLKEGDKVKATIRFRGREIAHPELGQKHLIKLTNLLSEVAVVERPPVIEGRNMFTILAPKQQN